MMGPFMEHDAVFSEKNDIRRVNYFLTADGTVKIREKNSSSSASNKLMYLKRLFKEVFLPQFYPHSVSSDYMRYQIWDTIQAFCSTISGTLTTHAIFRGIGVGDTSSTALSATITWIMKDGTGMIGRILFAWWKGYSLDTDCKKWRLAADLINDAAMCIELLLGSVFFKNFSSYILCCSTAMKAIVGVAGGATRASIRQHQAIRNNMADVSAKDGSQETCVNLVGSLVSVFLLTHIEQSHLLIWIVFVLTTMLHIFANYKAVKSLNLKTLNQSRYLSLTRNYLRYEEVFRPERINMEENVFVGFGVTDFVLCKRKIHIGHSLKKIMPTSGFDDHYFGRLKTIYEKFPYCIAYDDRNICVMLGENISDRDVLMSYFHAIVLGVGLFCSATHYTKINDRYSAEFTELFVNRKQNVPIEIVANAYVIGHWSFFINRMNSKGWNVDHHQLLLGGWKMKWNH